MSSWMNTRMNLLPLCTSNVCPTNSGMIVHARAQVLMGCLARFSFSFETFLKSFSSTNGPFLALLLISVVRCQWSVVSCRSNNGPRTTDHGHHYMLTVCGLC